MSASEPNITYNSSVYTLDALASLKGGSLRSPDAGLEAIHTLRTSGPGLWDQESIAVGWLKSGETWATRYFSGNVLAMQRDPDLADMKFVVPSEGGYALPPVIGDQVRAAMHDIEQLIREHTGGSIVLSAALLADRPTIVVPHDREREFRVSSVRLNVPIMSDGNFLNCRADAARP